MRGAFVAALIALAARDERVLLLTADLGFKFLEPFRDRFPNRFFNVGVAEDNLMGVATGLAEDGYVPFTYTMAAFALSRTFEIVRNGPVAHDLPVRIVGVGGGFDYGVNGPSHYALDDLALARALGALDILVPADDAQAQAAIFATQQRSGPVYLRLATEDRGSLPVTTHTVAPDRIRSLKEGRDVCVVALGPTAFDAMAAADALAVSGVAARVVVVSSLRPFDIDGLRHACANVPLVVTLENHASAGGLGSIVAEALIQARSASALLRLGVDTLGFPPGSPTYLRAQHGLDGPSVARRIVEALREA